MSDHHVPSHIHLPDQGYTTNMRNLLIVFIVTSSIMVLEITGGLLSNSLALLSDAGHMFTDVLALSLSILAMKFARTPPTPSKTYGFYRLEIVAAFLNGLLLCFIAFYIFYEAFNRLFNPQEVKSLFMLGVAFIGLLANGVGIFFLSKANLKNLNVKSAFFHMVGDTISSVGVMIGGVCIFYTGLYIIDSFISILIGLLILRGAYTLVKESIDIFLEATPKHINQEKLIADMCQIEGVKEVHHLHLWTITSGLYAMSAHVLIYDQLISKSATILADLERLLHNKWGIGHTTIQFESEHCGDDLFKDHSDIIETHQSL